LFVRNGRFSDVSRVPEQDHSFADAAVQALKAGTARVEVPVRVPVRDYA
jgi:hypothetical protein